MHFKNSQSAGFSILEVLITAAIIGVVTAIVVIRYGAFNNSVLLKSQAYEMALDLREAQVFAVSVREGSGGFRDEYGIYFTTASSTEYQLFIDSSPSNQLYDPGEELGDPYRLDSRFGITNLTINGSDVSEFSVVFKRPDFDAIIEGDPSNTTATIVIEPVSAASGETRTVEVTSTGQITVQ